MQTLDQLLDLVVVRAAAADAMGLTCFSCLCVDCGVNTAPAIWRGRQVEPALPQSWEFYWVKTRYGPRQACTSLMARSVWAASRHA